MNALPTIGIFLALCAASCKGPVAPPGPAPGSEEITFKAADGVTIYADLYKGAGESKTVVLMFHQAGSNAKEYAPIAPRVAKLGVDCLAIDQRSGGGMFDASNRTQMHIGEKQDYMAAYLDMQAALKYAVEKKYSKIIAWGSSYSAALVLRLAAENSRINAVVSFSPGEYFADKAIVAKWNSNVAVPALYLFTEEERGDRDVAAIKWLHKDGEMFASGMGVHGSSTLRDDRNQLGAAGYWRATEKFLKRIINSSH